MIQIGLYKTIFFFAEMLKNMKFASCKNFEDRFYKIIVAAIFVNSRKHDRLFENNTNF